MISSSLQVLRQPDIFETHISSDQMAVLYVNRLRCDELALDASMRKGHLEGTLHYVVGNVFVRVDIVDVGTERIVESTRVIFTGSFLIFLLFLDLICISADSET